MVVTSPSMMTFKRLHILLLYHSCIGHTVNHNSSAHAYRLGIERCRALDSRFQWYLPHLPFGVAACVPRSLLWGLDCHLRALGELELSVLPFAS